MSTIRAVTYFNSTKRIPFRDAKQHLKSAAGIYPRKMSWAECKRLGWSKEDLFELTKNAQYILKNFEKMTNSRIKYNAILAKDDPQNPDNFIRIDTSNKIIYIMLNKSPKNTLEVLPYAISQGLVESLFDLSFSDWMFTLGLEIRPPKDTQSLKQLMRLSSLLDINGEKHQLESDYDDVIKLPVNIEENEFIVDLLEGLRTEMIRNKMVACLIRPLHPPKHYLEKIIKQELSDIESEISFILKLDDKKSVFVILGRLAVLTLLAQKSQNHDLARKLESFLDSSIGTQLIAATPDKYTLSEWEVSGEEVLLDIMEAKKEILASVLKVLGRTLKETYEETGINSGLWN